MKPLTPGICGLLALWLIPASSPQAWAQSPSPPPPPAAPSPGTPTFLAAPPASESRLKFLENTYDSKLRLLEAPLLKDYLRDLDALKQSLINRSHPEEAAQVDAEMTRVKQLALTSGVLELPKPPPPPRAASKSGPPPPPPPKDGPKPLRERLAAATLALSASDAQSAPGSPSSPTSDSLILSKVSWKVSHLPAGTYDLMVLYACAKTEDGPTLQCQWNNSTPMVAHLNEHQATGSAQNFRILRMGQITLDKDADDAVLGLEAAPENSMPIYVRSFIFTKPKPKPKPKPDN